jgi:hypothetical protein
MAFIVQIASSVDLYIRTRDRLTLPDQERIIDGIREELGKSADRFVCSANGHVYGVTEVVYAEEHPRSEANSRN